MPNLFKELVDDIVGRSPAASKARWPKVALIEDPLDRLIWRAAAELRTAEESVAYWEREGAETDHAGRRRLCAEKADKARPEVAIRAAELAALREVAGR